MQQHGDIKGLTWDKRADSIMHVYNELVTADYAIRLLLLSGTQPTGSKPYNFFQIGTDHLYEDDHNNKNCSSAFPTVLPPPQAFC